MRSGKTTDSERGRRAKVNRLIEEYDLDIEDELIDAWTRQQNRRSLRDLADDFNRELLRAHLDRHGAASVGWDVETIYRRLQGDETSSGSQTRVRRQLERDGIDVAELRDEFVSHTAIRTFFRNRDVTRTEADADQVSETAKHVRQLQSRTAVVAKDKLETLESTDRIRIGDFRVLVDVQVFCEDCERQFDINELLEARHCSCYATDSSS
ncbi:MAG: rod-determining factor RdfA [Halorhabdus sp.]